MFKNCVLKPSVNTVNWLKAAGIRAIKTMAQVAVSMIVVGTPVTEVEWMDVLSVSLVAGIASMLNNIAGIPEVGEGE